MPSLRQQHLAFVKKHGHFLKVKGKGLIHHHTLNNRFKKMNIGAGAVAHHKSPALEGGAIRHYRRPYEAKDNYEVKERPIKHIQPILFKL